MSQKRYDAEYFRRWYRPGAAASSAGWRSRMNRKAALAVATAEYHLGRSLRSVLDVGCGEGAWRAPLLRLRPRVHYLGFDNSAYAVARYGRQRNLHLACFGDFARLRPCAPVDLLVCSDVMHYLSARELDLGLPGLAELCAGAAFLETFTREDEVEGDTEGFHRRPERFYRERLTRAGFAALGSHLWLSPALKDTASALELG